MRKLQTKFIEFASFRQKPSHVVIVQLMMACNDLQRSNEMMSKFKSKRYHALYFLRLQISQLHEALKVIDKIKEDDFLMKLIEQCDSITQETFRFLIESPRPRLIKKIRHNITFHYSESDKLLCKAIVRRSKGVGDKISSITRASNTYDWHFKIADEIIDSIINRDFTNENADDFKVEFDRVMDEVEIIFVKLLDFSGELIWRFV